MMIDGRFDQHFAELLATSMQDDPQALSPLLARTVGLLCTLGLAVTLYALTFG